MANPTAMTGGLPGVFTCTDAVAYCTCDPDRIYTLKHDGENAAGAASTHIIYLAFNGTAPDPDGSEGPNKAKLCSGDVLAIGPGITSFGFDMEATQAATMTVIPSVRVDVGAGATPDGIRAATSGTEELTAEFSELTDATAVHLAAGPTRALLTGGLTIAGVPAAEAAGRIAAPWLDLYRRPVIYGANLGEGSLDVTVRSTPGKPVPLIETGWVALTAPGAVTPTIDVRNYKNLVVPFQVVIGGCTDVDYIIWGSIDGVIFFILAEDNLTAAEVAAFGADTTGSVVIPNVQINWLYCEHEAEAGDTDSTILFQLAAGN